MRRSFCAKCGTPFSDRSPTMPRKYCYTCAPQRSKMRRPPRVCVCDRCGDTFLTRANGMPRYCSDECSRVAKLEWARIRYRMAHPLAPGRTRNPRTSTVREMVCTVCGQPFGAKREAKKCPKCRSKCAPKPRYCGDCGAQLLPRHRKCHVCSRPSPRFKVSDARRVAIYERDGWKCWICGDRVDPADDPVSGREYPTLDHVIPRSAGGTHEDGNLRCAHRSCNSSRGNAAVSA